MTISSSLNVGVSGLAVNATRLATISDNIANSSTYGYKRMETEFNSLIIGDVTRGYTAGGVSAQTMRMIDEAGSLAPTESATDLAIRGGGMMPVARASQFRATGVPEMLLTTSGSFRLDKDGYLANQSGYYLMGWPAIIDGTIPSYPRDTADGLEPIHFGSSLINDPTTQINISLNLPAVSTQAGSVGDPYTLSVEYFDNLGVSQDIGLTFSPTVPASGTSNQWIMTLTDSAQGHAMIGQYTIQFDDARTGGGQILSVLQNAGGLYDPATGAIDVGVAGGPIAFNIGAVGEDSGLSQLSDKFAPIEISKDGSEVGNMVSVEVDQNGYVRANFDNGVTEVVYQIPLVDLPNPNGMLSMDNQTFLPSNDSGPFFLWNAGDGPTGDIVSYSREQSTTDIAKELTAMIQTQRAYSSNAKVIQTVDEMLQETTNIKR